MLYQTLTLAVIGMFFALATIETSLVEVEQEELKLSCSCKKRRKSSLKEAIILACEGHEEPLEEETV